MNFLLIRGKSQTCRKKQLYPRNFFDIIALYYEKYTLKGIVLELIAMKDTKRFNKENPRQRRENPRFARDNDNRNFASPEGEENEGQIEGRNALTEALRSGRTIDKVFIAAGETDRGLQRLAADAKEAGAVVVPVDRRPVTSLTVSSHASSPHHIALTKPSPFCSNACVISSIVVQEYVLFSLFSSARA